MATVEVKINGIQINLTPSEQFWSLKRSFFIPVNQIRGAEANLGKGIFGSMVWALRVGTALPGLYYAGRFFRAGGSDFLVVKPGTPTLQLNLTGKTFRRVLISIPEAAAKAEEINTSLAAC